jgi:hypothetical protein
MAGLSLTVTFLDPELEACWTAPADTPAFRRGALADRPTRRKVAEDLDEPVIEPGAPASQEVAGRVVAAIRVLPETAAKHEQELGRLDGSPATVIMVRAWCSLGRGPFARPRRHTNPVLRCPHSPAAGRRWLVGERRRDLRREVGVSPARQPARSGLAPDSRGQDRGRGPDSPDHRRAWARQDSRRLPCRSRRDLLPPC